MLGPLANLLRAARFRLWTVTTGVRLRRLGGRLVVDVPVVPRYLGLPTVEVDGGAGTLTLRIGKDVRLGSGLVIDLADGEDGVIELGDGVLFQNGVRLQPWGGSIRIAGGAQIRDRCELKSSGDLRIGDWTICGRGLTMHCAQELVVGAKGAYAERVTIIDSDHRFEVSETFFIDQPIRVSPVHVGDNVFIGTNAVLLRGTTIGANSVVAAAAVVNGGTFPDNHLIGGIPARALGPLRGETRAIG